MPMEATFLPPSFMKDMHIFRCAITSNRALSFEAFSYPTSLHSLAKNVLEEESHYNNPPSASNSIVAYLYQRTDDKGLEFAKLKVL